MDAADGTSLTGVKVLLREIDDPTVVQETKTISSGTFRLTRIRREATTSSVEALRSVVGVDVAQTGVDRREVALRGFNSAFSRSPYVLTDHRQAAPPGPRPEPL